MTKEWWANLHREAANDLTEARVLRLLEEFKFLGNTIREKAQQTYGPSNNPASRDEETGVN
jgi:hypothetical protein